jgi:hypothetical protein
MANTFAPFGFRPFRHVDGAVPTMGQEIFSIVSSDASVIFTGDPVVTGVGSTEAFGRYVTGMANSSFSTPSQGQIVGIFVGCEYYNPTLNKQVWSPYFPGSVATSSGTGDAKAYVITDPDMLWICQVSSAGSPASVITSSYMGQNVGFSANSSNLGNTTTGISGVGLATSTPSQTNTLPFRIIDFYSTYAPPGGFVNGSDNTTVGQTLVVQFNNVDGNQLTGLL